MIRNVYGAYEDFVSSLLNLGQDVVYVSLECKSVPSESSKKEEDAISMFIKRAYWKTVGYILHTAPPLFHHGSKNHPKNPLVLFLDNFSHPVPKSSQSKIIAIIKFHIYMTVCSRHSAYSLSRIFHNEHNQVKGLGVESKVVSSGEKKAALSCTTLRFNVIWNISAQICKQFSNNVLQVIRKIGS